MTNPIYFAPYQVPFVDLQTGIISREWYLFLQAIFNRVGGSIAPTVTELNNLSQRPIPISSTDDVSDGEMGPPGPAGPGGSSGANGVVGPIGPQAPTPYSFSRLINPPIWMSAQQRFQMRLSASRAANTI